MAHPLSIMDYLSVADVMQTLQIPWPPGPDGTTTCPHCATRNTLTARPDPHYPSAWWFVCRKCRFAGDQFELFSPEIQNSEVMSEARDLGVPFARGVAYLTYHKYKSYVARRRAVQAKAAAPREPKVRVDKSVDPVTAVGAYMPPPAPGLWAFGTERYFTVGSMNQTKAHQCIGVPVYDLPDRVCGFITRKHDGPWAQPGVLPGSGIDFGGVLFAPALYADGSESPSSWNNVTVVVDSPTVALRLYTAHRISNPGKVPRVLAVTGGYEAVRKAALNILPQNTVVWMTSVQKLTAFAAAAAIGCRVARPSYSERDMMENHPAWVAENVIATARPWADVLTEFLQTLSPHDATEELSALGWDHDTASRAGTYAHDVWAAARNTTLLPIIMHAGRYLVRESVNGWTDVRTGTLLCDTRFVVEDINLVDEKCFYVGKLYQGHEHVPFTIGARALRRDAVTLVERACIAGRLKVPYFDPNFVRYYAAVAAALRPVTG